MKIMSSILMVMGVTVLGWVNAMDMSLAKEQSVSATFVSLSIQLEDIEADPVPQFLQAAASAGETDNIKRALVESCDIEEQDVFWEHPFTCSGKTGPFRSCKSFISIGS